jgi:spermidine/putrescine transport system substrate-binding protein
MAFHPRERRHSRRQFLRLTAYGAAVAGIGPSLLAACGGNGGSKSEGGVKLSRPDQPVTLPLFDDIPAIADGQELESGGALKVYNYEEYIAPDVLAAFEEEYGLPVEVTTFTSMDEAVTKLASGEVSFDVFFPTPDRLGQIVAGGLLQPLNKTYLPNLANVWESLRDPFYDQGGVYTVPYTLYTTGIGYRTDAVATTPEAYDNPYDIFWDPANSGQVYLLEDDREVFGMVLLRRDAQTDVNTEDAELIDQALADVTELTDLVNVKIGAEAYTVLPEKRAWVHQCWSGDVINAQYYLPEGESIENIGYWKSPTGVIGSDTIAVMAGAAKPVAAHTFLNFLLDADRALENYGWLGYQPPQVTLDPNRVVAEEYVPAHLESAVVRPEDFAEGQQLLQLTLAGEKTWDDAWSKFTAGG